MLPFIWYRWGNKTCIQCMECMKCMWCMIDNKVPIITCSPFYTSLLLLLLLLLLGFSHVATELCVWIAIEPCEPRQSLAPRPCACESWLNHISQLSRARCRQVQNMIKWFNFIYPSKQFNPNHSHHPMLVAIWDKRFWIWLYNLGSWCVLSMWDISQFCFPLLLIFHTHITLCLVVIFTWFSRQRVSGDPSKRVQVASYLKIY